jgi:hypothetical protein
VTLLTSSQALAVGIMGVLFFVVNCVFAIIILIMCFFSSIRALMSKNPDNRYQPMRDDRGSFIKSQTNLDHTELDALGATARGDGSHYGMAEQKRMDLEYDNNSTTSNLANTTPHHVAPLNGRTSPAYSNPPAYQSPYPRPGGGQQFRSTNNVSPTPGGNMWQRGVGY